MHVLVVEEKVEERELIATILALGHHTAVPVADATTAAHEIATQAFDAILVDAALPRDGARQILRRCREAHAAPSHVVLLVEENPGKELAALVEAGVTDFIRKPLWAEEILVRLALRRPRVTEAPDKGDPARLRMSKISVPAWRLRAGMVVVNEVRDDDGDLIAAAGSTLTSGDAARICKQLGQHAPVEVAMHNP